MEVSIHSTICVIIILLMKFDIDPFHNILDDHPFGKLIFYRLANCKPFLVDVSFEKSSVWAGKHLKQVIIQFLFNRYHKTIHYYFPRETIMYTWQYLFVSLLYPSLNFAGSATAPC